MNTDLLPSYRTLINPALEAMRELDGGGRKVQISEIVAEKEQLSEEQLSQSSSSGASKFSLLMNSVRVFLLNADLISQPRTGYWQLTAKGWAAEGQNIDEIAGEHSGRRGHSSSRRKHEAQEQASQVVRADVPMPSYDEMYTPAIKAMHKLGGSGTNQEILEAVVAIMGLTDEQVQRPHKGSGNQTEVNYRLGWVKTRLKRYGLLENPNRGLWALTPEGQSVMEVDVDDLHQKVDAMLNAEKESKSKSLPSHADDFENEIIDSQAIDEDASWRKSLYDVLHKMHPSAFERLFQRVLRESGFTQVDVLGRSGDGGIDGIGVMRLGGFLSFRVLFQCKRYKGSVGAGIVRDFRGAMMGRTDKGLIVTTGNFTREAVREATRDGAPEIDLIDGEQLLDKLKELKLGVKTKEIVKERVVIDENWFDSI